MEKTITEISVKNHGIKLDGEWFDVDDSLMQVLPKLKKGQTVNVALNGRIVTSIAIIVPFQKKPEPKAEACQCGDEDCEDLRVLAMEYAMDFAKAGMAITNKPCTAEELVEIAEQIKIFLKS